MVDTFYNLLYSIFNKIITIILQKIFKNDNKVYKHLKDYNIEDYDMYVN